MRLIDGDALKVALDTFATLVGLYDCDQVMECIDAASTIGGWVNVKDRLPERKWVDCLVATRILTDGTRGVNIAWLNDDNGNWLSDDNWICDGREIVTHWQPLPELPKEEADEHND